jgi:hypothetical protein
MFTNKYLKELKPQDVKNIWSPKKQVNAVKTVVNSIFILLTLKNFKFNTT